MVERTNESKGAKPGQGTETDKQVENTILRTDPVHKVGIEVVREVPDKRL